MMEYHEESIKKNLRKSSKKLLEESLKKKCWNNSWMFFFSSWLNPWKNVAGVPNETPEDTTYWNNLWGISGGIWNYTEKNCN